MRKRSIFLSLSLFVLFSMFLISSPIFAGVDLEGNGTGSGSGLAGSGEWLEDMSGYRFTIVDSNFKAVKNINSYSIDILFELPDGDFEKYNNSRACVDGKFQIDLTNGKNREFVWKSVIKKMKLPPEFSTNPPHPMEVRKVDRVTKGLTYGKEFYEWMMKEVKEKRSRIDILVNCHLDENLDLFYFEPGDFKNWRRQRLSQNFSDDTSRPLDYMNEMGYNLIIEPIYWFRPMDSYRGENVPRHRYKNIVYGTFSNFVQWYLEHEEFGRRYKKDDFVSPNSKEFENHGGNYSILISRAGKTAMTLEKNIVHSVINPNTQQKIDEILIKVPSEKILHLDGKVNTMEQIKDAITGEIGNNGKNAPYGYGMHFYYLSRKPNQLNPTIPNQPSHDYNLTGKLVISSDEFDVSKEQPVDEDVSITATVDAPIVMDYRFKKEDYDIDMKVYFKQPYSDGTIDTWDDNVTAKGSYYLIDTLHCFQINQLSVKSRSLQDQDKLHIPIYLGEEHLIEPLDEIKIVQHPSHLQLMINGASRSITKNQKEIHIKLPMIQVPPPSKEENPKANKNNKADKNKKSSGSNKNNKGNKDKKDDKNEKPRPEISLSITARNERFINDDIVNKSGDIGGLTDFLNFLSDYIVREI